MLKELNIVKELTQEGKIQNAVSGLWRFSYDLDNEVLMNLFLGKYINKEVLNNMSGRFEKFNIIIDENIDFKNAKIETYYEMNNLENGKTLIQEVAKDSIMESIKEVENILKVA